ncbi:MAG: DUF4082 domain-containing protein, partial [Chitinophagaceae bacterium]
ITGTATDAGGGVVASVEVSVDGGASWSAATINAADGNVTWSYSWQAGSNGTINIKARGVDDSGNIGNAGAGITVTVGADVTPPTVLSVSPTNGSTGVSINTTVTANFSESVNGSTVTGTTFQLKAGSTVIPATVNTASNQITLTPTSALANSTTYTVTIKGGASGVKDLWGNALLNDKSWSFVTGISAGGSGATTIFQPTSVPSVPNNNDGQGIELGVRFQTMQNGFITGIRYYKGAGTTGTHTGNLWSNTGTLLATAIFTNETASGWQQVLFSNPVAVIAGVTYVASQYSPSGHYASTLAYFTQAVVNAPLRGLADGEDGINGLYKYSPSSTFPTDGNLSTNYWVDVVFNTGSSATLPVISLQPSAQTVCDGKNVDVSSAASGNPSPTVQWQTSTNGTTWANINGATNSTLSFTAAIADNNKQYRAVWKNSEGTVYSNTATLNINAIPPKPTVTVVNNCGNSVLTAGSFTGSLLWSNGATTPSTTVTTGGTYTVMQTVNGCASAKGSGIAAPKTVPSTPTVTVTNNCGSSVLTAGSFTGSLLWSNGATTASITVATAGTYTVMQTVNGCASAKGSGIAAPKSVPSTPTVTVTNNCGSSRLTASGFTGSLLWSNGATSSSITVTTAGIFTVKQTIGDCRSLAGSGTASPKAIPVLSGSLAATVNGDASFVYTPASTVPGTTFAWTRAAVPGIKNPAAKGLGKIVETLVNTTNAPVKVTYVYTLTANGCINKQNVIVTVNPRGSSCVIKTFIESDFNSTAIPAGRYIWFNSSFSPGSFEKLKKEPVTITVTNSWITFKASNRQYTLKVPDSRIRVDKNIFIAGTGFINNVWETTIPVDFNKDIFMGGLSYRVPVNFPGKIRDVKWTADISIDKPGISVSWKWGAAVYTRFADHPDLKIKPVDGPWQNPYQNTDYAGTPENYKAFVVAGATGNGKNDYNGEFSKKSKISCKNNNDDDDDGDDDDGDDDDDDDDNRFGKIIRKLATQLPKSTTGQPYSNKLDVTASPNPSSNYVNLSIRGELKSPVTITILDIFGQVMEKHERIGSNSIVKVGENWKNGIYFAVVVQGSERKMVKIIKAN